MFHLPLAWFLVLCVGIALAFAFDCLLVLYVLTFPLIALWLYLCGTQSVNSCVNFSYQWRTLILCYPANRQKDLDEYFDLCLSLSQPTFWESMAYEWMRLLTFINYPRHVGVSSTRLAGAGFFYDGDGEEVRCFSCGVSTSGGKLLNQPLEIHRHMSPSCLFTHDTHRSGNVPIGQQSGSDELVPSCARHTHRRVHELQSRSATYNTGDYILGRFQVLEQYSAEFFANNEGCIPSSTSESKVEVGAQGNASTLKNQKERTKKNSSSSDDDANDEYQPNAIPKHPYYVSELRRLQSFSENRGWPHQFISYRSLVECGFFFTGKKDRVTCFHCGLGLRNWTEGQEPFNEHVLWSSKCPFLYEKFGLKEVHKIRSAGTSNLRSSATSIETTYPKCWIDDVIIDKAQTLIKTRFPDIGGLQSCSLGALPGFLAERGEFIQIVNTEYINGGQHWIVLSTVGKQRGYVDLFDTDPSDPYVINETVERCIAKLLHCENDYIVVNIANCDKQGVSSNDCGPYAIAISFTIASGHDPIQRKFKTHRHKLRHHLRHCLATNTFEPFPYFNAYRQNRYNSFSQIPVHCICRMPEKIGTRMLKCKQCSRLFHFECVNRRVANDTYICVRCKPLLSYVSDDDSE